MTSALHAEGPRFDPGFVYPFLHAPVHAAVRMHPCMQGSIQRASIAQMVERKTLNLVVVGSIPTGGAFLLLLQRRPAPGGRAPHRVSTTTSRFSSVGRASD